MLVLEELNVADHFVIPSGSKDHNTGLLTTRNRLCFFCRHEGSIDARNTTQEAIEVRERPLPHNAGTATLRGQQCLNEKQSNMKDHSNNLLLKCAHTCVLLMGQRILNLDYTVDSSIPLEASSEGTAPFNTALQQISEQQHGAARFDAADRSAHCSVNRRLNDCSQTISITTWPQSYIELVMYRLTSGSNTNLFQGMTRFHVLLFFFYRYLLLRFNLQSRAWRGKKQPEISLSPGIAPVERGLIGKAIWQVTNQGQALCAHCAVAQAPCHLI